MTGALRGPVRHPRLLEEPLVRSPILRSLARLLAAGAPGDAVTLDDLYRAGYSDAELARHLPAARSLARRILARREACRTHGDTHGRTATRRAPHRPRPAPGCR